MAVVAQGIPIAVGTPIDRLTDINNFTIKQDASLLEMVTQNLGCGCCEVENTYQIFGTDAAGQTKKLFVAKEESDVCGRCCCAPNHALLMHFFDPPANGGKITEEMAKGGAVWTMERPGCCSRWLNCCCPLTTCCQQEMWLHEGHQVGKPGELEKTNILGRAVQPTPFGGCCTPTLHIMERGSETPNYKLEGPTCFGGCSEMCCETHWPISKFDSDKKAGDVAMITKETPKGLKDAAKELFGDADTYSMTMKDENMTAESKATFLASLMLMDYWFFERDSDMIACKNGCTRLEITCCLWYCCGVLYPCKCAIEKKQGDA